MSRASRGEVALRCKRRRGCPGLARSAPARSAARRRGTLVHRLAAFAALALGSGCGGGAALMHPAHTLPAGRTTVGAGVSHQVVLGAATRTIEDGIGTPSAPASAQERARAMIAAVLLGPGSSPWLGARVGVGHHSDVGMTYTGRSARLDVRHAFETDSTALSVGAAASAKLGSGIGDDTADVSALDDPGTRGYGFDLPILVGWRSDSDFLQAWLGVRGGYEHVSSQDLNGERWSVGGLVGLMVGVRPVWVVLELDGAYLEGRGRIEPAPDAAIDGRFHGFGLAPTGALLTRF